MCLCMLDFPVHGVLRCFKPYEGHTSLSLGGETCWWFGWNPHLSCAYLIILLRQSFACLRRNSWSFCRLGEVSISKFFLLLFQSHNLRLIEELGGVHFHVKCNSSKIPHLEQPSLESHLCTFHTQIISPETASYRFICFPQEVSNTIGVKPLYKVPMWQCHC